MGRFTSIIVIGLSLSCSATALAVDRWSSSVSPPNESSRPGEFAWKSSTFGDPHASTAAFEYGSQASPLDTQVSEFIATTTTRLFGSSATEPSSVEIAALIHPLCNASAQLKSPHHELDLLRATSLTTIPVPGVLVPASLESSGRFLNPTIAGMASPSDATFGFFRFQ